MVRLSMKKLIIFSVLTILTTGIALKAFANDRPVLGNFETASKKLDLQDAGKNYNLKNYTPYLIAVMNRNPAPIMITANTGIVFVSSDGTVTPSESRRQFYLKNKKLLKNSNSMMSEYNLPLRFEPGKVYNIQVFAPAELANPVAVNITNVTFDKKRMCDINIPLNNVEEL